MKDIVFISVLSLSIIGCVISYYFGAQYGRAWERERRLRNWRERELRWREFDDD